jgi:hypothetical protein
LRSKQKKGDQNQFAQEKKGICKKAATREEHAAKKALIKRRKALRGRKMAGYRTSCLRPIFKARTLPKWNV